ncbi:diaminopimelate decarboxylase [Colwellia psychrerythraea]|uniref:Diaminopimelate decarboxylase n=1 Tax=Colwellia psychrerythraea TaxID=28229 RepID=A0A099KN03_COLPS|nr:diaminopimelate decarboxylase [Colwellia psychrerythraea]KGJ91866.1 diaminopimelate decarboxylase [Colwellia psychrerythraea]
MTPVSYFPHQNNHMYVEGIAISDIAKQIQTPFYCYSSTAIETNYQDYQRAFSTQDALICYAVKANSNQAVLATLAKLGSGADVVSMGEIRRAITAGIPANKIVYSGVAKTLEEISYALSLDILQFNVESEPELALISKVATSLNKTAAIAFRINPDVCAQTHAKISTGNAENKFGVPISKARLAYKQAAALPGIKVQGVDVHIGSQLTSLAPFAEAYKRIAELVIDLRSDGHDISVVDVGGGLGITYLDEIIPSKQTYADMVTAQLSHLNCKIIIEPGRSLLGNAGILVSSVVFVKTGEERQFLMLDAGMNDLIRPSMYEAYHQIIAVDKSSNVLKTYDVVGPVCETGDTFAKAREVHQSDAGDLIAIMSSGAYGAVMSSSYNTRLLVPEVMVKGNEFAIVRKRPSYEDIIKQDITPSWL